MHNQKTSAALLVKGEGAGSYNFPTDTCKFPTEKVRVLRISFLSLNSPKMGNSNPKFSIFGSKFSDKNKIFRQCPPRHVAMENMMPLLILNGGREIKY